MSSISNLEMPTELKERIEKAAWGRHGGNSFQPGAYKHAGGDRGCGRQALKWGQAEPALRG
jgi:hypothetical protein